MLVAQAEGRSLALLALLAVGLVLGCDGSRTDSETAPGRPDVFLIVLDAASARYFGSYGESRPTTPEMDRLAEESVVFDSAYSQSATTVPSTVSLLTGVRGTTHQMSRQSVLPDGLEFAAELFSSQGYRSLGFIGNPYAGAPELGLDQGYEEVVQLYALPELQQGRAQEKSSGFRVTLPEDLNGREDLGDGRAAAFAKSLPYQAGVLLAKNGQDWYAEMFLTDLAERLSRDDLARLGQALDEMGDAHLQVMAGKAAASEGRVANGIYYPLHPMQEMDLPIDMEMALAIARRESEFDFSVRSHAGAEGLMQVMPGTARDVARDTGVAYDPEKVRNDWRYNAQLGASYLAQMAERFDGNILLVSAAYNAGPHRADQWIEALGDPRDPEVDVVDWVEHIPFRETRNYVQRVAESLPIYRARLGRDPLPQPFSKELAGRSLTPSLSQGN